MTAVHQQRHAAGSAAGAAGAAGTAGIARAAAPGDTRRFMRLPGPWRLELGGVLEYVDVAYETYGRLNAAGDNAVLVCHALTGDSHPASHHPGDRPGWWEGMIGPGRYLDTDRWFVVCSNVLGGCAGSTGAASPHPEDGRPYGLRFPLVTVGDMVRVQRRLLEALGVRRLALVVGGSLGGMQALEWGVAAPDLVERVVAMGAPWASSPQAIAWNEIGRHAIMTDPDWAGGLYNGRGPARGLAVARMLAMISYRSWEDFARRFGRARPAPGEDPVARRAGDYATRLPEGHPFRLQFEIESYLHYQGEKLVRRFDANAYLYLTRAMDLFDLGVHGDGAWERVRRAGVRFTVVGIDTDLLYPAEEVRDLHAQLRARDVDAVYREITSPHGHDAFLLDIEQAGDVIREALG